jgi:hypothetical protein
MAGPSDRVDSDMMDGRCLRFKEVEAEMPGAQAVDDIDRWWHFRTELAERAEDEVKDNTS